MIQSYPRYKYEKPPIQEAIFEAKFSHENLDSTLPGQFYEKVRHEFPEKNDLKTITLTLGTAHPNAQQPVPQVPTMQTWNDERTRCLQIGPGIIAANILKYQSWENFTPAIDLLLNSYFQCTHPEISKRVGIRYINRFVIPQDNVVISDYFRLNISLPNTLIDSTALDLLLVKSAVHDHLEITTKIRFASDTLKPSEQGVVFLLDIDSFVTNNISVDPRSILQIANSCHDYLNAVFESTLQDKIRSLLGGIRK